MTASWSSNRLCSFFINSRRCGTPRTPSLLSLGPKISVVSRLRLPELTSSNSVWRLVRCSEKRLTSLSAFEFPIHSSPEYLVIMREISRIISSSTIKGSMHQHDWLSRVKVKYKDNITYWMDWSLDLAKRPCLGMLLVPSFFRKSLPKYIDELRVQSHDVPS